MTFERRVLWMVFAWLVAWELHATVAPWLPTGPIKPVHLAAMAAGTLVVFSRAARRREERLGWALVGAGLLAWTAGEAWYSWVLWDVKNIPVPSLADAGYLMFPVLFGAGLVVLLRARFKGLPRTLLLDGATAALAAAGVSAAVVVGAVVADLGGTSLAAATNLAYPVSDLVLLGMIVGAGVLIGVRDRTLLLLGLGVVTFWIADSHYLITVADGTYQSPSPLDAGWWVTPTLFAWAALRPAEARAARVRPSVGAPLVFAAIGVGVLVTAAFVHVTPLAVVLAALSLVALIARTVMTFRDHAELLRVSRLEAVTDGLTGLGNRRALTAALDRVVDERREATLGLFDLDGFKQYNDTFGHPAGDQLLARLGGALADTVRAHDGSAFRMGGDEFCILVPPGAGAAAMGACVASLCEHGEGFTIGCSAGAVTLPDEASAAEDALRTADGRMYADKTGRRGSPASATRDVLLRVLAERDPSLSTHGDDVADLAGEVAGLLGMTRQVVDAVRHAAELHDVGKLAIPDTILAKAEPLDPAEWEFMRRHPVIGERIVVASGALPAVAPLVRASHERWDGGGYPDGLAGEEIPLGARIIAVCDAYDAMVTDRPYRRASGASAAVAELARCAGSQFDPRVVAAFSGVVVERARAHAPGPAASRVAVAA